MVSEPYETGGTSASQTAAAAEEKRRPWFRLELRDFMPKGLFARSLLIIIMPIVILQGILTYVFFERHWDTVTRRLSRAVAGDIAMLIDAYETMPGFEGQARLRDLAGRRFTLSITLLPGEALPEPNDRPFFDLIDRRIENELEKQISHPFWFETERYPNYIDIRIEVDGGVMRVLAPRSRVYSTSSHIFLLWMVGASFVLVTVAILFLRNQIRPIQRLADAAESFGKGREIGDFKPSGATEVRRAAAAFLEMKERIQRQIEQRTEMLAGVSHDLRTPLTRFKLELAMLGKSEEIEALQRDVREMEHMLEDYLQFARGQSGEEPEPVRLSEMLKEIVDDAARQGETVGLTIESDAELTLRRNAFKRCVTNLVENANAYAERTEITVRRAGAFVEILVDDDGPGIPPELREEAFKPFHRLDIARNQDKPGTGLGLAITRDVARAHGGDITLSESPLGGLRATVRIPV